MNSYQSKINYPWFSIIPFALFFALCCVWGCGGDNGGSRLAEPKGSGEVSDNEQEEEVSTGHWKRLPIACWSEQQSAAVEPRVKASLDNSGKVHLVCFQGSNDTKYQIIHMVGHVDTDLNRQQAPFYLIDQKTKVIACVDNCTSLAFALVNGNEPVVAYRGGTSRGCDEGDGIMSDAMLSLKESGVWSPPLTAAKGATEEGGTGGGSYLRIAANEVATVTDSSGCIHLCYQLLSENCDAKANSSSSGDLSADLYYVKVDRSLPDVQAPVTLAGELVEEDQGDSPHHIGSHCAITLDADENPVIFYCAELADQKADAMGPGTRGLRVARKEAGAWKREWIERECDTDSISCARYTKTGCGWVGVAYSIRENTAGEFSLVPPSLLRTDGENENTAQESATVQEHGIHYLRYAWTDEQFSGWQKKTVDDAIQCGEYCSLAFDSRGFPAIAYGTLSGYIGYSRRTLNFARFNGSTLSWNREFVFPSGDIAGSSAADIGLYNNLWFDQDNRPFICSSSSTQKTIFLFYRDPP
ncbi:MAG: hypothetical protein AB1847_03870 [bacterium]